ncbi:hypothetical protein L9G15_05325 [Shewanella sp. A3A]|nr:hypothetical protein [Shewanella ferrihydritica]
MNYREQDLDALNIAVRWLDKTHAKHAYEFACHYMATGSYNLHSDSVTNIIEHRITSDSVASHWLASHFPSDGTVQIIYGPSSICVVSTHDFLLHWTELFMPSRDDAIVLHNPSRTVMCYCHDQILSIGERIE